MFDVEKRKVKSLFNDIRKFEIPDFQRGYVWGIEEIDEFFEDLQSESLFFIGSFILKVNEDSADSVEIIDGQQRTVTISLFYTALSYFLDKASTIEEGVSKDATLSAFELRKYVAEMDPKKPTNISKFKIDFRNEKTNKFFVSLLSLADINELLATEDIYKKIKKSYSRILDLVEEFTNLDYGKLIDLREKIENTEIIVIRIQKEEIAYQIFETVNARGVDLTVSDLLKNHLFRRISNHEKLKEKWSEITDNLQQTGSKKLDLSTSLRFYWISNFAHITKRRLYRAIKNEISEGNITEEKLLDEIYDFSVNLGLIYDQDQSSWVNIYKENQRQAIRWFFYKRDSTRTFDKSIQYLPIYTSILNRRDIIDIASTPVKKLLHLIESINFVYLEISNLPGNVLEKMYSEYSRKINTSESKEAAIKIVADLCKKLQILLNDKTSSIDVEKYIDNLQYTNRREYSIIMFILIKLEYLLSDFGAIVNNANISVEHISAKKNIDTEDGVSAIKTHSIGNLTIMQFTGATGNGALNDTPFEGKIDVYSQSPFALTRNLAKYKKWDERSISERTRAISKVVWEVWGPIQKIDNGAIRQLLKECELTI